MAYPGQTSDQDRASVSSSNLKGTANDSYPINAIVQEVSEAVISGQVTAAQSGLTIISIV